MTNPITPTHPIDELRTLFLNTILHEFVTIDITTELHLRSKLRMSYIENLSLRDPEIYPDIKESLFSSCKTLASLIVKSAKKDYRTYVVNGDIDSSIRVLFSKCKHGVWPICTPSEGEQSSEADHFFL